MSNAIKVKLNGSGRAIITLYSKQFDVTDQADEDGSGELKAFGRTYKFEITGKRKQAKKANPIIEELGNEDAEKPADDLGQEAE